MTGIARDLRHTLRRMRRAPGFTVAVVVLFALGAGVNATIFSVLDSLVLKTLPVPRPSELVLLHSGGSSGNIEIAERAFAEHYGAVPDLFSGILWDGGVSPSVVLADGVQLEAQRQVVSADYFDVLGIPASTGRLSVVEMAEPAVVLDFGYWRRTFAGNSAVVGRELTIDGVAHTIAGVTPPDFFGLAIGIRPDVYSLTPARQGPTWAHVVARLKPGRTAAAAERALAPIFVSAVESSVTSVTERQQHLANLRVTPLRYGLSHRSMSLEGPAWLLMAVSVLLLLVAGFNLASLMVTRNLARRTEIATQIACGATRSRLATQFAIEAGVLALAGGLAGLVAAHWTSSALVTVLAGDSSVVLDTGVSVRVVTFTIALLSLTVGLFGILPTIIAASGDPLRELRAGSAGQRPVVGRRVRSALVIGQLAGSVALLAGTGVLVQSFSALASVDVGFAKDRVISVALADAQTARPAGQAASAISRLLEDVRQLPGVQAASLAAIAPFSGNVLGINVTAEGGSNGTSASRALWTSVSTGYFDTMGIPIREGRDFSAEDDPLGQPAVIINETLARRHFGSASPLGRRLRFVEGNRPPMPVVGVVADAVYRDTREDATDFLYVPRAVRNGPALVRGVLLIRMEADEDASLIPAVRGLAKTVDPGIVVRRATVLADDVEASLHRERSMAELSAVVSVVALILAAFGLYGTLSMTTLQRTREIGLRVALGASNRDIRRMVIGEALWLSMAGLAAGVFLAILVLSILGRLVVDLPRPNIATSVFVLGALALVTLTAATLPARRAVGIHPARALKAD